MNCTCGQKVRMFTDRDILVNVACPLHTTPLPFFVPIGAQCTCQHGTTNQEPPMILPSLAQAPAPNTIVLAPTVHSAPKLTTVNASAPPDTEPLVLPSYKMKRDKTRRDVSSSPMDLPSQKKNK